MFQFKIISKDVYIKIYHILPECGFKNVNYRNLGELRE